MTPTGLFFDIYWEDLTECARTRLLTLSLTTGLEIPADVLDGKEAISSGYIEAAKSEARK